MTKNTRHLEATKALYIAETMGLLAGPKTKHCNAKVQPALFEAAARRAGTQSPGAVISAALASLATEDDVGSWLAARWGALAELDPDMLALIDF
jgi:hypothetical protein